MSVSSPVSYQLLRLIKWRINGVIKGPNDPREGKIGLKGKMGAITADTEDNENLGTISVLTIPD